MRVIGTAGHVDHGKSTLVQALTGTHPDRLKEEREREMTIDLGFAFLSLPDGEEIGFVDVPGHRDFIENMLAGVGGIDAVLFVVAADEGVMPQTREHLAILDLLKIQGGVVALTKIDMVADPDWVDLIEDDLEHTLEGTVLDGAPIIRVSAVRGDGIEDLRTEIARSLDGRPVRVDRGRPRLPVDRVFTIAGFGTVVTGTLIDGHFGIGDEVELQPSGGKGRVRGLQSHNRKEDRAVAGSRTAINISGLTVSEIDRGSWVIHPGEYQTTRRIDLQFDHLASSSQSLKHDTEVKFFIGTAEVIGRTRVLGVEEINPGDSGWIQIELREPVVAIRGDRYILRRPSPGETIGGGVVVEPHPKRRYKRFSGRILDQLAALAKGDPKDVIVENLRALGTASQEDLARRAGLGAGEFSTAFAELLDSKEIRVLGEAVSGRKPEYTTRDRWERISVEAIELVGEHHKRNPLRVGVSREELKSRMKLPQGEFNELLKDLDLQEKLIFTGSLLSLPGHRIQFNAREEGAVAGLLDRFRSQGYSPPTVKESLEVVGSDVFQALLDLGELVQVSAEVVFRREEYQALETGTRNLIEKSGSVKVAEFRDHFRTTRKYALPFLEHLDAIGITIRVGDERRLKD